METNSQTTAADDARALIARFGASAYDVARTRAREARLGNVIDGNRGDGHWDRVRAEIARRTKRALGRYGDAVLRVALVQSSW